MLNNVLLLTASLLVIATCGVARADASDDDVDRLMARMARGECVTVPDHLMFSFFHAAQMRGVRLQQSQHPDECEAIPVVPKPHPLPALSSAPLPLPVVRMFDTPAVVLWTALALALIAITAIRRILSPMAERSQTKHTDM